MKTLALLTCLGLLLSIAAALTPEQAWPTPEGWSQYGGSVRHTGASPLAGPTAARSAFPSASLAAASFTAPITDRDGNLYVGDDSGVVHKFRPDLTKAWTSPALGAKVRASAALGPDGTVYVAPVAAKMSALDGATGQVKWQATVNNAAADGFVVTAAPVWHPAGFVVQPSMDGNVYAINGDGTLRWGPVVAAADKCVAAAAIGADGTSYLGCQDGVLRALKPDGQIKWSRALRETAGGDRLNEQQVAAPSIAPDGTIYVTTRVARSVAGSVYALTDEGSSANLKWRRALNEKITTPVTVRDDGALFVGDLGGDFYRLDPATGNPLWTFTPRDDDPTVYTDAQADTPLTETLAVAELAIVDAADRVYVPYWHVDLTQGFPPQMSFESPLYALNARDGSVLWREIFPKTLRSPVLGPSDRTDEQGRTLGILYAAGDDGKLHARGEGRPGFAPATSSASPTTATSPPTSEPAPGDPSEPSPSRKGRAPGPAPLLTVGLVALIFMTRRRL